MSHVGTMDLDGHPLELVDPEFAKLDDGYSSARPTRALTSILGPPCALIVTREEGQDVPLKRAIESQGWSVKTCAGPGTGNCPIMRGERCLLRESVDAAVVYLDPRDPCAPLSALPRLRCAGDSSSPGVVALEGHFDSPTYDGSTATVGALRGPEAILTAISALLGSKQARDQMEHA